MRRRYNSLKHRDRELSWLKENGLAEPSPLLKRHWVDRRNASAFLCGTLSLFALSGCRRTVFTSDRADLSGPLHMKPLIFGQ